MKPHLIRVSQWVLTISMPLLLLAFSARLVMTPLFLQIEYTRPGFPEDSFGFTTDDRLAYGHYAVDYMLYNHNIAYLERLRLPARRCINFIGDDETCPMFNVNELHHMQDVQHVAQALFMGALIVSAIAAMLSIILWRMQQRTILRNALLQGSMLTIALLITVIVIIVAAWDVFFDTFHAMFFEAGTWRFYFSDTLIRLYPEQFWVDASLTVGTITGVLSVVIFVVAWRWRPVRNSS